MCNLRYSLLVVSLLTLGTACRNDEESTATDSPAFRVRIFCNNYQLSETHGCDGGLSEHGEMQCGPEGNVSKLTWRLIKHEDDADVYEMTRVFPYEAPSLQPKPEPAPSTVTVHYTGVPVVVFEDAVQRIVVYPADSGKPPTINDQTPRAQTLPG